MMGFPRGEREELGWKTEEEHDVYEETDTWVRPLLQELGEREWRRGRFIIAADLSETGEERGWIVRQLAGTYHYHIGIRSIKVEGEIERRFFIRTGGDTVFSKNLGRESLQEALDDALKFGPTHLEPPGRRAK